MTTSPSPAGEVSLLWVATVVLRHRRVVALAGLTGLIIAVLLVLLSPRQYVTRATFIPQGSESSVSALSMAASQFGIRVPSNDGSWDPVVYVELLRSRALLEPVADTTYIVAERGDSALAVPDLLEIEASNPHVRRERAVRRLRKDVVLATEDVRLRAVRVSATTEWASVSLAIVEQMLAAINDFNLRVRNSQATAERSFVGGQVREAEHALREAEDRLQSYTQANRLTNTPSLRFEQDRLERDVTHRQQMYTSLLQNWEEARLREVRDTPVITVIEAPQIAPLPESRGTVIKGLLGGLLGTLLAVAVVLALALVQGAGRTADGGTREFLRALAEATPRFARWRSD